MNYDIVSTRSQNERSEFPTGMLRKEAPYLKATGVVRQRYLEESRHKSGKKVPDCRLKSAIRVLMTLLERV